MHGLVEVINSLSTKYQLPESEVRDALNLVLIGPEFRRATNSVYGELSKEGVVIFSDAGVSLLGEPKHSLARLLTGELERILTDAATVSELQQWSKLTRQVIRGRIDRITAAGTMEVIVERTGLYGVPVAEIVAECEYMNQSLWDRDNLRPGQIRFFHVQRVQARRQGTAPARIAISLSRRTPALAEYLIRKGLQGKDVSFKCSKRVAGKVTYIESDGFIPTHVIKEAGRELGERIKVDFTERDTDRNREKS